LRQGSWVLRRRCLACTIHCNQGAVVTVLGDADAYIFDFDALPTARKQELIRHHLAAFHARRLAEDKPDWAAKTVPFALLGHSIPPELLGRIDLSAPHEGVLMLHSESSTVLYVASNDDERLAVSHPEFEMLSLRKMGSRYELDAATTRFDYAVDRTESEGFTLGEIETFFQCSGAELTFL
jgi:hypothetical protein